MNGPDNANLVLDLVRSLRPTAAQWGTIFAGGRWALSFPPRNDLLFFRVDHGSCYVVQSCGASFKLEHGDCLMTRTCGTLILASDADPAQEVTDSWNLVAATRSRQLRVGASGNEDVVIRGGHLVLDTYPDGPLLRMVPPMLRIGRNAAKSERVRGILAIMEAEVLSSGPITKMVVARLAELLLLGIFNDEVGPDQLLPVASRSGLAHPTVVRALAALHNDFARAWTLIDLAKVSGSSRSTLTERFTAAIGVPPMTYLHRWRMTVAKDELRQGRLNVDQIASFVGFQSGSAFSTAFTRMVGCSPTQFAKKRRAERAS